MVTAALVKELREKTGAGMMDCKKVLTETEGDMERAAELLRERGIAKAAKKSDRIAADGLVATYVSEDKKVASVIEVNSETDFVAKNEEFKEFVEALAMQVANNEYADVEALLAAKYINEDKTVQEVLTDKIAKIGENMSIRRFTRLTSEGTIVSYIHGDGKIAVLVDLATGTEEVGKDICLQITAARPEYLNREEVPAEKVAKEMEILKAQAMNEGKPEAIAEKIVAGRIDKFYGEICLIEQSFVKDPDQTIKAYLKANNAELNRFVRIEKGEGLAKKEENFAEEVAKQLK